MAANTANLKDPAEALDLNNIRNALRRMEDSIIFSLVERAQFLLNEPVYAPDNPGIGEFKRHQLKAAGSGGCLGDYFLYETECLHAQARRYSHPTEYSFFSPLPEPIMASRGLAPNMDDRVLAPHSVSINKKLLETYRTAIMPVICNPGDDGNHGSTAVQDIVCLQTISTRIYYGLFVAESKFRAERERFTAMIKAKDAAGLMAAITKADVEAKIIQRVIKKVQQFSVDIVDANGPADVAEGQKYRIDPTFVGQVFEKYIMPLTKDVEVAYLLTRLESDL
eukprot:SAG31_NODE_9412_length_1282_cov_0.840237_1_plen_280_part_00